MLADSVRCWSPQPDPWPFRAVSSHLPCLDQRWIRLWHSFLWSFGVGREQSESGRQTAKCLIFENCDRRNWTKCGTLTLPLSSPHKTDDQPFPILRGLFDRSVRKGTMLWFPPPNERIYSVAMNELNGRQTMKDPPHFLLLPSFAEGTNSSPPLLPYPSPPPSSYVHTYNSTIYCDTFKTNNFIHCEKVKDN